MNNIRMKIVSNTNTILEANASYDKDQSVFGLILESRGGAKGKKNERNRDYLPALDCILDRLKKKGIAEIQIFLVSSKAIELWNQDERRVTDNDKNTWSLNDSVANIRRRICRALQAIKENKESKGGNPTKRILISATEMQKRDWVDLVLNNSSVITISDDEIDGLGESFDPGNAAEAKDKILRAIAIRKGQKGFRGKLLKVYKGKCAITGTDIPEILEAAHIVPYSGKKTNHICNGILLRTDIHTLYDLQLIGIDKDYRVHISKALTTNEIYGNIDGKLINLPENPMDRPSQKALIQRPLPE